MNTTLGNTKQRLWQHNPPLTTHYLDSTTTFAYWTITFHNTGHLPLTTLDNHHGQQWPLTTQPPALDNAAAITWYPILWTQVICRLLNAQQHASVSLGQICLDNCICCHTETETADQTCYLTESWYTDTGQTSPSTDLIMSDAWQGSH